MGLLGKMWKPDDPFVAHNGTAHLELNFVAPPVAMLEEVTLSLLIIYAFSPQSISTLLKYFSRARASFIKLFQWQLANSNVKRWEQRPLATAVISKYK
jgi:hypothetical protein